jgi:lipopolysaccharide assembly outer membrane protein LptD (OstA)
VDDHLLVRSNSLSGNEVWLVVQYEYAPGFDEIDMLAAGGTGHYWLNDFFNLGFTAYRNEEDGVESGLYGANLIARMSADSWLKFQGGFSQGLVSSSYRSNDGGFGFDGTAAPGAEEAEAGAFRVDATVGFSDFVDGTRGQLTFYFQRLYAGYSAPGLNALSDTDHYGGTLDLPLLERLKVAFKADRVVESEGLATNALEADVRFAWSEELTLSAGVRYEDREDDSPVVLVTQKEGSRTDLVVEAGYDPGGSWNGYAFAQGTVQKSGDQDDNRRGGIGGSYRFSDRLLFDGEVSYGDSGPAVELGTDFQQTERTSRYLNYSLDNERAANGLHARRGSLVSGARTRVSDSASVYSEDRYQHTNRANGLSRAMGFDWAPDERWSLGVDWEYGTLIDSRTNAETKRNAGGGRVSYHDDKLQLSSGIEYRSDETEQTDGTWSDRTTWLFRNNFRVVLTPDWRVLGKLNHSFSDSSLGEFFDGGFTEAVLGYAYRPVKHDRLNILAKYTYFFNRPTTDVVGQGDASAEFLQKSHILSLDASYDLTRNFTVGGKYAFRHGEVSLTRENPEFFDNSAHLILARGDYSFLKNWEASLEGRILLMPSLNERKGGAVITIYRYLGKHFKIGIGYNFTDFSEDLTDLSYDHHGFFFNLIGTL